jgi:anaerobic magnesium-protoporphyrin IX monomethyl ester cyclase
MKAALIGPIQQENLALGYLASFAQARGHEVSILAYAYRHDLDATVAAALACKPDLIGLGIAFQNNIEDYTLLIRELRARGFAGHITCGGHVPTFCWDDLLNELPELDTVVRHDGEETLAEMLDALGRGEEPRELAGLVWREGGQLVKGPVRVAKGNLDALPWPARSGVPYVVGGMLVDFLITARGCVGECNYCSIAAYTSEQQKSYRLRAPESVADEIAKQYHERGARVFFVQDDLFILPKESAAIARMDKIKALIDARGVGDVVFWVKGRPENITLPVAKAARAMGAIHMFLGIENASAPRLKYLGRTHLPMHNRSAIQNCVEAGLTPSFNFMLFDPDCSLDDIAATLDMAEKYPELPWNVCRTEVYSGTSLKGRLEQEGRLEGNWRSYGYRMRDERAEVMFRIVRVSFHERALAIESLLNRLISLSFARQLHEHFYEDGVTRAIAEEALAIGKLVRSDTVERLRHLHAFVSAEALPSNLEAQRFAIDQGFAMGAFDMPLRVRVEALWNRLHNRGRQKEGHRDPNTNAASEGMRRDFGIAAGS